MAAELPWIVSSHQEVKFRALRCSEVTGGRKITSSTGQVETQSGRGSRCMGTGVYSSRQTRRCEHHLPQSQCRPLQRPVLGVLLIHRHQLRRRQTIRGFHRKLFGLFGRMISTSCLHHSRQGVPASWRVLRPGQAHPPEGSFADIRFRQDLSLPDVEDPLPLAMCVVDWLCRFSVAIRQSAIFT